MYLKKLKIKKKHSMKERRKKSEKLTQFIQEKNYTSGINEKNCKKI